MREPLFDPGDSVRTMSRMPFGGSAVLDIARPLRSQTEEALSRKAMCFLEPPADRHLPSNGKQEQGRQLCRLGLGDFEQTSDSREPRSRKKSAFQMEAPFPRRTPIQHLAAHHAACKSANRSATDLRPPPRPDRHMGSNNDRFGKGALTPTAYS